MNWRFIKCIGATWLVCVTVALRIVSPIVIIPIVGFVLFCARVFVILLGEVSIDVFQAAF